MPTDDLEVYAVSETDFYALLGITFETSQRDIDRAWRKTALKYHPDKVGNDLVAKEKFHLAQIGYDLLSDPANKALYDSARNARIQKERKFELLNGRRRTMANDLLARERGVKRGRDAEDGDEEKLENEIQRLAEDGKRRRKEREDALRRNLQQPDAEQAELVEDASDPGLLPSQTRFSEIDRTVRIRWPQEGQVGPIGQDQIISLFSKFGKIESADLLKPKMLKTGRKKQKEIMATCMIQYASVVGAHTAVEDFKKQQGAEWERLDSVFWAANKEPGFINAAEQRKSSVNVSSHSSPSTPRHDGGPSHTPKSSFLFDRGSHSTAGAAVPADGRDGLRKRPSFTSFSSAAFSTPTGSPARSSGLGVNSPSFEEMTMIRLKNAEKKRLAEEIMKQDEAAAAAAAAAAATTAEVCKETPSFLPSKYLIP